MTDDALLAGLALDAGYRRGSDVLREATLHVFAGSRLVLMGANGSGKTTLLRCLSGAHEPDAGRVLRHGEALRFRERDLNRHRRSVQLVLQDPDDQLFSADVRADVSFGPLNLGLPDAEVRARVEETLQTLGLEQVADRPVHRLSHGQRKRVAIAGAVAMRPELLLLDEPTAGLDPATTGVFEELLAGLEASGTTVVIATHDVDLAWRWSDQVAVVHNATVTQGPTADILTDDPLLAAAQLQLPWQVDLLRRLGVDYPALDRPRTVADLAALLGPLD